MRYKKGSVRFRNHPWRICKLYGTACKKSGRGCKPSDEINLIRLMYLDLSATKWCSFWRHGFRKQVLLSRWKYAKLLLDRPTNQGNVASRLMNQSNLFDVSNETGWATQNFTELHRTAQDRTEPHKTVEDHSLKWGELTVCLKLMQTYFGRPSLAFLLGPS